MKARYFYKTKTIDGVLVVTVRANFFDSIPRAGEFFSAFIADFRERMEGVEQPRVIDLSEIGIIKHVTLSALANMFKNRPKTIPQPAVCGPAYLTDFWPSEHLGHYYDSLPEAINAVLQDQASQIRPD